jgi:hypothetical protein
MAQEKPTVKIEKFLGLMNTAPSERLPHGALSVADNVDIDDDGGVRSCPGFTLALMLSGVCAAYTSPDGKGRALYIIDSAGLKQVFPDPTPTPVLTSFQGSAATRFLPLIGISGATPQSYSFTSLQPLTSAAWQGMTAILLRGGLPSGEYSWTEAGTKIFYAGPACGIIENGEAKDWRIPTPPSPALTSLPGVLTSGTYQVTCAYVASDGREGAAPVASQITLTANQALRVEVPRDYGIATAVYISPPDGAEVYLAVVTASTDYLFNEDITRLTSPLAEMQKQTDPVPDVDVINFHAGKLYGAQYFPAHDYTALWCSQPFAFHLFDLHEDHLLVPGRVLMLASTGADLVIGTDREIFAYTGEGALVKLAGYGVVPGRPAVTLAEGGALFWTERGVCQYPEFKNLTEQVVSLPPGNSCSVALVERGGLSQFIILNDGLGTAHNANF